MSEIYVDNIEPEVIPNTNGVAQKPLLKGIISLHLFDWTSYFESPTYEGSEKDMIAFCRFEAN